MVLGKLPVPGRPTIWIEVGQGPTALAVGAGVGSPTGQPSKRKYDIRHIVSKRSTGYETFVLTDD